MNNYSLGENKIQHSRDPPQNTQKPQNNFLYMFQTLCFLTFPIPITNYSEMKISEIILISIMTTTSLKISPLVRSENLERESFHICLIPIS